MSSQHLAQAESHKIEETAPETLNGTTEAEMGDLHCGLTSVSGHCSKFDLSIVTSRVDIN